MLVAAAVFGAAYCTIVAVTILWSTHVYADHPATGVAAATGAQGVGLLTGSLTGGLVAEITSLTTALLAGASILVLTTLLSLRGDLSVRATRQDPIRAAHQQSGTAPSSEPLWGTPRVESHNLPFARP